MFPKLIWQQKNRERKVFISFDDGPDPQSTVRILEILRENNALASFFCLGKQVEKYPEVFSQIRKSGNAVGNHGYSHISGWRTNNKNYFTDIHKGEKFVASKMYRPAYGQISPTQINFLVRQYDIYMWEVMPGDFDSNVDKECCLARAIKFTSEGSIVVFHDSARTIDKLAFVLPRYLRNLQNRGFIFDVLVHPGSIST